MSDYPTFRRPRLAFHWAIAAMLLIQVPLAWYMIDLPEGASRDSNYGLHKALGMVIFAVAVLRLVWALISKRPPLPPEVGTVEKVLAKLSQAILYIMVILMPISGWLMSSAAGKPVDVFGLLTLPMLVALVLLSWPATSRLVRGQILQIREEGYINASRLLGAKNNYLVVRHMIPNTMGVILVTLTFAVPSAIFTEAFLSFIGMGVAPPTPSWGSMCNEGIKTMLTHPHELIFPALFISITVLAFNMLGDGLRDALDARMRNRE